MIQSPEIEDSFLTDPIRYHTAGIPDKSVTSGVTHVITAFANSSLFASDPAGEYKPFKPLNEVRALFNNGTKVCMAIGGWGDTDGFGLGAATNESRHKYAINVAETAVKLGYDCVGKSRVIFHH